MSFIRNKTACLKMTLKKLNMFFFFFLFLVIEAGISQSFHNLVNTQSFV